MEKSAETRFWSKVSKDCWFWIGSKGRGGYGSFRVDGKNRLAHRVAYELARGTIPPGMTVDHLCRIPACVNPDHLELCSLAENVRRSRSSNGTKTRCPKGHKYTPENTMLKSWRGQKKHRSCRICFNERHRGYFKRLQLGLHVRAPKPNHNSAKTHCPKGHEYTPENTAVHRLTCGRSCRTCKRADGRRYKARLKAERAERRKS
jgi:hypothetical protein